MRAGGGTAPGPLVFPPPAFDDEAQEASRRALLRTDVAQPAVGAACVGMLRLLRSLGLEPDVVGGHSYGELVALHAAGVMDAGDLAGLSSARGRFMIEAGRGASGAMAAILAGPDAAESLVREVPDVQAANWNGPRQTVVAGPADAVQRLVELATARGIGSRMLPVSSAFHTPMVAAAREPLSRLAIERIRRAPDRPVYSNIDAAPYPDERPAIAARLGDHLARPVRFADMIEAMYRDGVRVFVEVGPGAILTSMVESILADRPHLAVACDAPTTPGLPALLNRLARLVVAGLPLRLERLTDGRSGRLLDLDRLPPGEFADVPTAFNLAGQRQPGSPLRGARTLPTRHGARPAHRRARFQGSDPDAADRTPPPQRQRKAGPSHDDQTPACTDGTGRAAAPHLNHSKGDPVIESFQKTMQMFLEVQRTTMLAYLSGRGASGTPSAAQDVQLNGDRAHHRNGDAVASLESRVQSESEDPDRLKPGLQRNAAFDPSNGNGHHEMPSWRPDSRFTSQPGWPQPPRTDERGQGEPLDSSPIAGIRPDTPAADRTTITTRLLEIVRDRTGYPIETLGLDLDIEADLGIDSIKRVEILGKLRDEFPSLKGFADSAELMDVLARARTLGVIVNRMSAAAAPADPAPQTESQAPKPDLRTPDPEPPRVQRRVLEAVPAPLPRDGRGLMEGGRVVVTDDGSGVTVELAARLEAAGIAVDRLGGDERPVDWTSPSAIAAAVDEVRSRARLPASSMRCRSASRRRETPSARTGPTGSTTP